MKYQIDNDLHIHSRLSICSEDSGQTPEAILQYAKENGIRTLCLTDHYWDSKVPCTTAVNWWYEKQNFDHISQFCPLPQEEQIRFLFGCEVDMDSKQVIGVPKERWDDFDFMVVATTHFHHMTGEEWPEWTKRSNQNLADFWVKRFDAVLDADLPFHKVGIAHLACTLMNCKSYADYLETLTLIPQTEMERLFKKAAKLGVGIELNAGDVNFKEQDAETILRMFRIAKACGCKFYLGSDAHCRPALAKAPALFEHAIQLLGLEESDKFIL